MVFGSILKASVLPDQDTAYFQHRWASFLEASHQSIETGIAASSSILEPTSGEMRPWTDQGSPDKQSP